MYPIICRIGPLSIYSYGLMMALSAIICAFLLSRDVKKHNIKSELVYDFVFWAVVGGVVGARLFFIALDFSYFIANPLKIIMIQEGGLAWQGGFAGGSLAGWIFIKRKRLPILLMMDLIAPYLALGQAIGRLGCFLNGCCYGKHSEYGIYFPVHADTLHPTQLYDSLGLFVLFCILKGTQKRSFPQGLMFVFYLYGAATLRFVVEFFRADHETFFLGLSIFQWVCLLIITIGIYVHTRLKSQPRGR